MRVKTIATAAMLLASAPVYAAHYLELNLKASRIVSLPRGGGSTYDDDYKFTTTADMVVNLDQYPSEFFWSTSEFDLIDVSYSSSQLNVWLEDDHSYGDTLYFSGSIPLPGLDLSTVFERTFHGVGSYTETYPYYGYEVRGPVDGAIDTVFLRAFDSSDVIASSVIGSQTLSLLAAPEPAAWMMMVGGFGLIGSAMRRRRTAIRFA